MSRRVGCASPSAQKVSHSEIFWGEKYACEKKHNKSSIQIKLLPEHLFIVRVRHFLIHTDEEFRVLRAGEARFEEERDALARREAEAAAQLVAAVAESSERRAWRGLRSRFV